MYFLYSQSSTLTLHSYLFSSHSSLVLYRFPLLTSQCFKLLSAHSKELTSYYSLNFYITSHFLFITAHSSLLTSHSSLYCSLLILTSHCSPLTTHYSVLTSHFTLLTWSTSVFTLTTLYPAITSHCFTLPLFTI